jgi:hypothetical protein
MFPYKVSDVTDEYNLGGTLEAAQEELMNLVRERERLDWRISKLQTDIVHLAALCNEVIEDPIAQLGVTDAVRYIIAKHKTTGISVKEIVEALQKTYSGVSDYKNLQANVHTIIRRLIKAKEVELVQSSNPNGYAPVATAASTAFQKYRWIGGIPPMPPPPSWLKKRESDKKALYDSGMRGNEEPKE